MKNLLFAMLLGAAIYNVHAQKYAPGSIIDQRGDTVRCEIEFPRWDMNPTAIKVRTAGSKSTYEPGEIRGFTVDGETYVSAVVEVETSPYRLEALDDNATLRYRSDTVFLQVLVTGEKALLFLKDQTGKSQFYVFDGKYVHLGYKKYIRTDYVLGSDRRNTVENRKYVGQLTNYLNCDGISDKISQTAYEVGQLTKLFVRYYECSTSETSVVAPRHEMALEWGVVAGGVMTDVNFKGGSSFQYLVESDYSTAFGPAVGLLLDLKMMRGRGSRITNDFMFTSFNITGSGQGGGNGTVAYHTTSSFNFQYIKTHHAFQLALLKEGRAYVSGGISFGFVVKSDSNVKIAYDTHIIADGSFPVAKLEYGVVAGVGTNLHRFTTELRYEWSSGISSVQSFGGNLNRLYLVLKYRLKHKPQL